MVGGALRVTRKSDGAAVLRDVSFGFGGVPRYPSAPGHAQASLQYRGGGSGGASRERLYGFGETRTGVVDQLAAGTFFQNFSMLATYAHSAGGEWSIPVVHSSHGYSVLWNSPSFGSVKATAAQQRWFSDNTKQLDFVVTTTPGSKSDFAALLRRHADLTGHAAPVPDFATGFWQSRNRYRNQTQLLQVAEGYRSRGLPLSVLVIDYFHWKTLGDWSFNEACWPDPSGMVAQLERHNVTVMVSMWPMSANNSLHFRELVQDDMLARFDDGTIQPMDTWCDGHVYDPFSAATRARMFGFLRDGYVRHGLTAFWLDASEPEHILGGNNGRWRYPGGGWESAVAMAFPRMHQQMATDGLEAAGVPPAERIVLSRAAWAGTQRYGAITWSGDIQSTFAELSRQVRTAQGVAMSGIPLWTTDVGGYQGGVLGDPEFEELVVRWLQFGIFCPIARLHGLRGGCNATTDQCGTDNCPNELWSFEHYPILRDLLLLRESLRPYVAAGLRVASSEGLPLVRPMFLAFPDDAHCAAGGADLDDQYMFGDTWLVAPVLSFGAKNRTVYLPQLPAGEAWAYHFHSGTSFAGGARVTVQTPLAEFPLFQRMPKK
eukprot:g946.t1